MLTWKMKIIQGVAFGAANIVQIVPLVIFTVLFRNQNVLDYAPYILFYTGTKTGLIFVNGMGKVGNPYQLLKYSILVYILSLMIIGIFPVLPVDNLMSFVMGMGASVILPAYQTIYYKERVLWSWNIGSVEILSMFMYIGLLALFLLLPSTQYHQMVYFSLAVFICLFGWVINMFPETVKNGASSSILPDTQSQNDIILFCILVLFLFSIRLLRFFNNSISFYGFLISFVLFLVFFTIINVKKQLKIDFPLSLVEVSILNGGYEAFLMVYLFSLNVNHVNIVLAYTVYGAGIAAAQFLRKVVSHLFRNISELKQQLLFFVIGSWLLFFPSTILIGTFIIGYVGSANSILLNHAYFFAPVDILEDRLIVKYRNTYLGSILLQLIWGLFLFTSSLIIKHDLIVLAINNRAIQRGNIMTALFLSLTTIVLGMILPSLNERKLFVKL
ncbi:hypothetical protein ACFQ22_06350 [Lentilactobacillus raoultii]|uniref:O-antigen/teichoic acid export membrane protein n=1 Tax=Lentilactobacillus raoultii TaxID=1987503 RepID=A0ABW3PDQ1_9LACO|nr:hypothetical protein [Lentilactobacillus raoultii]